MILGLNELLLCYPVVSLIVETGVLILVGERASLVPALTIYVLPVAATVV